MKAAASAAAAKSLQSCPTLCDPMKAQNCACLGDQMAWVKIFTWNSFLDLKFWNLAVFGKKSKNDSGSKR